MNEFGDFIRKLRGDMTYREAAERSGISHAYIRYLEIGKRPGTNTPINPSPDMIKGLSKAYNFPYKELMKKAGYLSDEVKAEDHRDPAEKLIEYLEMELTDEEIMERMTFKVDTITLTEEEVKEFIAFVRAKRFMKSGQRVSPSKFEEL